VDTRNAGRTESSKNSICFFYPPLPFHLPSSSISHHCSLPFSSHRAGRTEARPERQSSSLHPRPAFASSPACECEQEPLRSAWARSSLRVRSPPSVLFLLGTLRQWGLAALHGSTPSKAKRFQGTGRTTKPQPQHFLSLSSSPHFLA